MLNRLKNTTLTSEGIKETYEASRGPKHYEPVRPGQARPETSESLMARSTVLQQQEARRVVPPPPRRGNPNPGPTSSPGYSPSPSPAPTTGRAPAPVAPSPRSRVSSVGSASGSGMRDTPAPPYSHAAVNDMPSVGGKRFSEYDENDKEQFFGMLDEFFSMRLGIQAQPVVPTSTLSRKQVIPKTLSIPSLPTNSSTSLPSYPPPQPHSSSALTLLHYILTPLPPSTPTSNLWYLSPTPIPPPLSTRTDIRWTGSWSQHGDSNSLIGFVLFGDTSVAWWKFDWSARAEQSGALKDSQVKKDGVYRSVVNGEEWDGERLYKASQVYGPSIVEFAEKALASRRPVARGECWDVASEALASIKGVPKPFPSIGRTHGFCYFYGRAIGLGKGEGTWKGGDEFVRPGDIVEWRKVTIKEVGMGIGSYCKLGDPDHTAVILSAGSPLSTPSSSAPYPIAHLNSLTVVEQSQGQIPQERTYDLAAMEEGEIWIYRPVGLVDLVGTEIEAKWLPSCKTWRVGGLE